VTESWNKTTSALLFRPHAGDDGKEIACRAENKHFLGGMLEDRRRLDVACKWLVYSRRVMTLCCTSDSTHTHTHTHTRTQLDFRVRCGTLLQLGLAVCLSQLIYLPLCRVLEAGWNVMAHTQKPDVVFLRNGRVHLNPLVLVDELCASAAVMLHTPSSEVVWSVLATHSIRQFPLHFPSRTSPYVITFQLGSTSFHAP